MRCSLFQIRVRVLRPSHVPSHVRTLGPCLSDVPLSRLYTRSLAVPLTVLLSAYHRMAVVRHSPTGLRHALLLFFSVACTVACHI